MLQAIPRLINGEKFAVFQDLLKKLGKVGSILMILTGNIQALNIQADMRRGLGLGGE
jgi:hypothetical protein